MLFPGHYHILTLIYGGLAVSTLSGLLSEALSHTVFHTPEGFSYDSRTLLGALNFDFEDSPTRRDARSAVPVVSDGWDGAVADFLRDLLAEYIDVSTDRLGHSFEVLTHVDGVNIGDGDHMWYRGASSVQDFALSVIRAAALLGPGRAADLVEGWARGEPVVYKTLALLGGEVLPSEPLSLDVGLLIYSLPSNSDELPFSVLESSSSPVHILLGQSLMELETQTYPALFLPGGVRASDAEVETSTALGEIAIDTFCLALSLVCDRRIGVDRCWREYGDLSAFKAGLPSLMVLSGPVPVTTSFGSISQSSDTGITSLTVFEDTQPNLTPDSLRRAWDLLPGLHDRVGSDSRFRVAVNRWARSVMVDADAVDRAIDLRIALEALYLDSDTGELSFRLATTCARHLGEILEERTEIWTAIRDFYGQASRAVHGTGDSGSWEEGVPRLERARELCRNGILKILESGERPVWRDLLLA